MHRRNQVTAQRTWSSDEVFNSAFLFVLVLLAKSNQVRASGTA